MDLELLRALNEAGAMFRSAKKVKEADLIYRHTLSLRNDLAGVHKDYGDLLYERKVMDRAVEHYRDAVRLSPSFASARERLAQSLQLTGLYEEAATIYESALRDNPGSIRVHIALLDCLALLYPTQTVINRYKTACQSSNSISYKDYPLGRYYMSMGDFSKAKYYLMKSLHKKDTMIGSFFSIAQFYNFSEEPHVVEYMKKEVSNPSLNTDHYTLLQYALWRIFDGRKAYKEAFQHLTAGADRKRESINYDSQKTSSQINRILSGYPRSISQVFPQNDAISPNFHPLFIVGLPRSGSTLIEQMLCGHSRVTSIGEVDFFVHAVMNCGFEFVTDLFENGLERFKDLYLDYKHRTERVALNHNTHILNKNLDNFLYLGAIRMTFANARIIHIKRNAADSCFACFSNFFDYGYEYSYRVDELCEYYKSYSKIMDYWRDLIPSSSFLEIEYEHLISDFDTFAKRIVDFCGLQWEERCLSFYDRERPVRTSSIAQVRRPLYSTSVGKWRNYEEYLAPMFEKAGMKY